MSNDDLFKVGIEIRLRKPEDFLKVKETLTRIGIASKKTNVLTQTCHILHKRGRYAILHFKEMFILDGKPSTLDEMDTARRNTIVNLLEEWELLDVVEKAKVQAPIAPISQLKIISFKDKANWTFVSKYQIGSKK